MNAKREFLDAQNQRLGDEYPVAFWVDFGWCHKFPTQFKLDPTAGIFWETGSQFGVLWDFGDTWWYFGVWVVLDLYIAENDAWCWKWWFINVDVLKCYCDDLLCFSLCWFVMLVHHNFHYDYFFLWWWLCFMVFHDGWSYAAMSAISNMFYELEPSAPWAPGYYGDSAAVAQCTKHTYFVFIWRVETYPIGSMGLVSLPKFTRI